MITDGRVALNGTPIDTPATILESLTGVTVDGKPVAAPAPARLFLFHKPNGVLVTERDPGGRPTIYDRLPKGLPRLMPVGRLDLNTEGLLLLTTDGELKRQLELPSTGVERAYRARAYGQVSQAQLEELIEGVTIDGVRYGSIDANLERRTGANVWIEIIITEGKNREVRKVLEHLGLKVSRLIRTRYGPFLLADLPSGGVVEVRQADIVNFRRNPAMKPGAAPMRFKETRTPARPPAPEAKPKPAPKGRAEAGKAAAKASGTPRPGARPEEPKLPARRRRTLTDPRRLATARREERKDDESDKADAPGGKPRAPRRPGTMKPRPRHPKR